MLVGGSFPDAAAADTEWSRKTPKIRTKTRKRRSRKTTGWETQTGGGRSRKMTGWKTQAGKRRGWGMSESTN